MLCSMRYAPWDVSVIVRRTSHERMFVFVVSYRQDRTIIRFPVVEIPTMA
jgi:hypothetical protein